MSRFDDLPADQKAALSLLLRRRQSYAQLASMLNISELAVHDRAHAGLAMLAPAHARALTAEQREQVGEFLLGQQHEQGQRAAAQRLLEASPEARAWANALVAELAPIGDGALPAVPGGESRTEAAASSAGAEEAAPARGGSPRARAASRPALPVSRTAGAILLAVLIAGVVLAAVLIPSGGGSSKSTGASGNAPASRGEAASSGGATPAQDKRITMTPTEAGSKSAGVVLILSEGGKHAFYLAAEHMPPSHGFFYAVWLYNSPSSAEALGKSPAVGSDGRLQGGALLPSDAANFRRIVVTRETNEHPTRPGQIVLSGAFALH